ncbi:MAG TPA: glycosyltransferase family 2 protein [Caulobacteraceae bacterium]|jgi:glycosyltransferase involved in cell wall biosynthesis|nr:glycosyltransferase family 2 protein [Caulobacteraceae bacterium]
MNLDGSRGRAFGELLDFAITEPPASDPPAMKGISCVVCAYNEADRIRNILDVIHCHPALTEVIVVNDGSTDDTEALIRKYPTIRVLSHSPNRGKTYALSRGIAAARCEHLMLLDADLAGIKPSDIDALAAPVMRGEADVSISLRSNSLWIYRQFGLDFVSGERVAPKHLLAGATEAMQRLPRWGGEVYMNEIFIRQGCRIQVVRWPRVLNIRKYEKAGFWRGTMAELKMIADAAAVLTPFGLFRQNLDMLKLVNRRGWRARMRGFFTHRLVS